VSDADVPLYGPAARHYLRGRPPYSAALLDVLTAELGLDGTGRLLDVGCGPGVLAVQLAPAFAEVVGVDPDPVMLDEASGHAAANGVAATWIEAPAERIPELDVGPARAVTFGQSFQWTVRDVVTAAVWDVLLPGGAIVLITHDIDHGPPPVDGPAPPIPDDELRALVRRYLGPADRAGGGLRPDFDSDRYEVALARSRFGPPRVVHAPGRPDLVRNVDGVIDGYLSMSWAAPQLFGADLEAFVADARRLLLDIAPAGRFWDWPGDTVALIADRT